MAKQHIYENPYFAISENERVAVLLSFTTAATPNLRKNCLVAGMLKCALVRIQGQFLATLLKVSMTIDQDSQRLEFLGTPCIDIIHFS